MQPLKLYYYPNRPTLVPPDPTQPMNPRPDYIRSLEASKKYVAGLKWNGDNTLIYTDDLATPRPLWNRKKARLKYQPSGPVMEELMKFPKGCILNAELMNNHTKNVKDTLIVHSMLAYEGKPLIGKSWGYARSILETFTYGAFVRLEELHKQGFWELFQLAVIQGGDEIEGIVLKDPTGIIQITCVEPSDMSWMLKIRKPSKKYQF